MGERPFARWKFFSGVGLTLLAASVAFGQGRAEPVETQPRSGSRPALFLGNEALPPMCFMERGEPRGIAVDLAEALAKHLRRPVEVRLADWAEAQQRVWEGRAESGTAGISG